MQEKIYNALKTKYSSLGLGDEILRAHAKTLSSMGLVNDENLDVVVDAQADFLKTMQSANDKRVTDALAKQKEKTDEETKKAIEEAKANAENALKAKMAEDEKKKAEEAKKKAEDKKKHEDEPDYVKELREQFEAMKAQPNAELEALKKQLAEFADASKAQSEKLAEMQKENDTLKAETAKREREAFISTTAKGLGIPEWRVNEGFNIAGDADNEAIKSYLNTVAQNIKSAGLQGGTGGIIINPDAKATTDEVKKVVDGFNL